jgi:hypothetical protein
MILNKKTALNISTLFYFVVLKYFFIFVAQLKQTLTMENENLLTPELHVDYISVAHLKETAKWAKFLAIVGFVFCVIIVIIAIFSGTFLSGMGGGLGGPQSFMTTGFLAAIYSIIAIIYFILSLFLYRFAGKMQVALQATDQDSFNAALYNLKLVYRISGIIVLVYLAFVALAMVFGVGMAAFS